MNRNTATAVQRRGVRLPERRASDSEDEVTHCFQRRFLRYPSLSEHGGNGDVDPCKTTKRGSAAATGDDKVARSHAKPGRAIDLSPRHVDGHHLFLLADLRPGGDGRRTALLKTVAGILGLELDALRQRDQQRRQRRLLGALAASLALSAITTALAIAALQARDLAQVRRAQAEQLIQFMMVDLRTRLETIGKLEVLDAVGDQASAYFGQVDTGELTVAERKLHATSLRQLGELQRMRGRHDEAEALLGEALALAEANARLDPLDLAAMDEIAAAQFELGTIAFYTGRVEASLEWCGRAAETARALIARDPDDPRWHRRLASARYLAAQSHLRAGGFAAALASATAAETAYRLAVSLGDPTVESARGLALTLTSLAVTHRLRGEPGDSLAFATRATDESRAVLALANSDYGDRYNLSRALSTLALARLRQGQVDAAVASAFESLREAETLQASDPSNGGWRQHHVSALNMMATTRMAAGDYALAAEHASRGIEELRRVANGVEDSDARQWTLAALLFKLSEAQLQLGDREAAVRAAEKGIAIWPDGHGGNSYVAHYLGALLIAALEAAPDREPDARHALLSSALDVLGDSNTAETEGLRLRAALLRGRIEDASGTHVRLRALGAPDFSVDRFLRRYCAAPPTAAAAFCDEISAASGS